MWSGPEPQVASRSMATIITARLVLRPFEPGDVPELFALHNDAEVMHFLTGGKPRSLEEVQLEYLNRFSRGGCWAAVGKSSGGFLGWFALEATHSEGDEFELGYRLNRAAWGIGYGTEGARGLIEHAFNDQAARRVWAETMAVNVRSRRVMEKAGLHYARTFHKHWDDPLPGSEQG